MFYCINVGKLRHEREGQQGNFLLRATALGLVVTKTAATVSATVSTIYLLLKILIFSSLIIHLYGSSIPQLRCGICIHTMFF